MKTRAFLFCLVILASSSVGAQVDTLNYYIKRGLENNLALQQKQASYEKSLLALKEARRMFYPGLSFNARYSIADGGRVIEFPVGDLMNPVYSTLNALTGTSLFPQIENQEFTFLRSREHETKLQLIQPVFNSGLHYNYKIRNELMQASRVDVDRYKRYLVAEIKKAYFNYLQTLKIEELVGETRELLEENLRVSNKLLENQKVTIDVVYRSQAELSNMDRVIAEVEKNKKVARSYLNFLLNRPLETPLYDPQEEKDTVILSNLEQAKDQAVSWREELELLDHYLDASAYNLKIIRSQNHPTLLAAVDYGFQGKKYRFTAEDDFVIASFILRWNLFTGFQNQARIKQAVVEKELLRQQKEEAEQQIRLEVTQAYYDLKAAIQSVHSAEMECMHARKAFRLVNRKFEEGMASLIEYMDARTSMTEAETNRIIARFDLQGKLAEYERVTASFDFTELQ